MPFVTKEEWRIFWVQEYTVLYTFAEALLGDKKDRARDVVQEACRSFYKTVGKGREVVQELTLLFRVPLQSAESAPTHDENGVALFLLESVKALDNEQLPDQVRSELAVGKKPIELSEKIRHYAK